jgi:hypothetical protein
VIRIVLPYHLRNLAGVGSEVAIDAGPDPTTRGVLDALEARYPVLRGTIRDHATRERRAFLRYFASGEDISFEPDDAALPAAVVAGEEPFIVMGAIAGG